MRPSSIHAHIHTHCGRSQPRKATASSSGAVRVEVPCSGTPRHTSRLPANRLYLLRHTPPPVRLCCLHSGHLADAFIQSDLHRLTHTLTHRRQGRPCKAIASSSGAVRVKCLAQGHIDTQLGGAGDGTSNLRLLDNCSTSWAKPTQHSITACMMSTD